MKCRKGVVLWCVVFAVVLSMGMATQSAYADTAKGQLMLNDEHAQFNYAYAIVQPNSYDETREDVVVLLTDHPLTDEAVEDEWTRSDLVQEKGIKYVKIVIASNESIQMVTSFETRLDPSGSSFKSVSGVGTLELKVLDETHVEGRYYTNRKEERGLGDTYDFDLTFQAEIRRTGESPQTSESPEEPEAETTADSSEIDEELAALSPEEKFERTVADMRKITNALTVYAIDYGPPSSPTEQDLGEVGI